MKRRILEVLSCLAILAGYGRKFWFRGFVCLMLLFGLGSLNAQNKWGHVIPADKGLSPDFIKSLYVNERTVYTGDDLKTIGMPCGGIASGQLYVRGDGSLACWWIANNAYNTGYGVRHLMNFNASAGPWKVCYQTFEPFSYVDQYFELTVESKKGVQTKLLNKQGFNAIEFVGEYPVAEVHYKDSVPFPVEVSMDVFSPFIPMELKKSATPATVLKFKVKNILNKPVKVSLKGVLQNMVMRDLKATVAGKSRNRVYADDGLVGVCYDFEPADSKWGSHPYNGNMSLSLLGEGVADADGSTGQLENEVSKEQTAVGNKLDGSVSTAFELKKGEEKEIVYLLSWFFPNRPRHYGDGGNWTQPVPTEGPIIGNMYSNWFSSSRDVVLYLRENIRELAALTYLFRDTWYANSTIPYWLRQRIMMPVSTLATETCQWWGDGRFWSWEGVGSCVGTCTHVWNYAQAQAYLFPELERNVRERTDFSASFQEDGGICTRNGWGGVHFDGQAGTVLKLYREHLLSGNNIFLSRNWEKGKRAMEFLIRQDANENGLLEGEQPNTFDISFQGANTYVGALYLASLRASETMAALMGEREFADKCHKILESGKLLSEKNLWNGEYFKQDVDLERYPVNQYANGCLSDQLFGQTWAHLLGLGYLYDERKVKAALNSVWKYNWAPDVGIHNEKFVPERTYADAGEPGLLNCTYPVSEHLNERAVRYRNEVWTGCEYQVAAGLIYEGRIDEGMAVVHGVHQRYQPRKHNPWNEIECGDHYARALASWGVLLALENYHYDGPRNVLGYHPQINKDDFSGFFSGADSWGTIHQRRTSAEQVNRVEVKYGRLTLSEIHIPQHASFKNVILRVNGVKKGCDVIQGEEGQLIVRFAEINLLSGNNVEIIQH